MSARLPMRTLAMMLVAACAAVPTLAHAQQAYPNKPIRIVISTTPGGQPDTIVRLISQKMSHDWGQPVVVDNRPGGGGILAATMAARATPDGYTLFYALPSFVITAVLQPNVPYDAFRDFAPASHIGTSTNILVATPALGAKSIKDFIALAKTRPGKLIFASSATGSASHLTGARFNHIAGLKVVHVAFKGGPDATIEVLAGRSHYHVGTMGVVLPFVQEGKLVALAVTSEKRAAVLPDVPALGETMPEFSRPDTSHGLLAPAGTPPAIVNKLSREIAHILNLADFRERMQAINYVVAASTPAEYGAILRGQIEALSKLANEAGLKAK
jgi:tripartite-type tricarboxylate transporter receptor subunit TctC